MEKDRLQELENKCIQECAPPCTAACPVHVDCRGVALLMARGDFPGALKLLRRALPFPAIIGTICDQPCRVYCNRGRAGGAVEMAALELAAARFSKTETPRIVLLPSRGKNVAVVGAGLSGLTAAFDLRKKGYGVTVFESGDRPGGNMWEYAGTRLSREIADRDFSILETMGIELRLQTTADPFDLPEFDAVYAAPGPVAATAFPAIDPLTCETGRAGFFAGGSLLHGPRAYSPIFSVSDGRRAVVSIDRFLQGASLTASRTGEGSLESCLYTNINNVAPVQAPIVPAEGFSLPEAEREAGRCMQCQCLECVKTCAYLESFGGYPKKYVREIYNNLSIVMGVRQSNTLINSCSLCGLCAEVCPNDLNMGEVCSDARRTMVAQKRMPPSAHDFALRDMLFANSDVCAAAILEPGEQTCTHLFFPGCQLAASAPGHVEKTYRLLQETLSGDVAMVLRCCGAPADWAGRDDLLTQVLDEFSVLHRAFGRPRVIFACPSCARVFKRLLPNLDTVSLWEVFDQAGIVAAAPQAGRVVSLHDPCAARHDSAVQESARRIAMRLNCSIAELPLSRRMTTCCSFGGLQWFANNRLARIAIERRMGQSGHDYLTYCSTRHGDFSTVIWRDADSFETWQDIRAAEIPKLCPAGCRTCTQHGQRPCCVLLEVTRRCELACSFCFASSGVSPGPDPDLHTIDGWYSRLFEAGGPFNIQLSGGEPCMRDDLEEIVALGRSRGFPFIQVNTNGLRIARDPDYLRRLADAGLSTVYLQFDATDDAVYERLRGARLLSLKQRAIERCAEAHIGVVLVATIVPGINDHVLGDILRRGLDCSPAVRGVHFQPVSYFGRYPETPGDDSRMTLPDCMHAVADQSGGLLERGALRPAASEHALCSFHGTFVYMPDGSLQPLNAGAQPCCACNAAEKARDFVARAWAWPQPEQACTAMSLGGWDEFLERARTHLFTVSGMAFQDAWTLDLERLHRCHIFTVTPEGDLVPFCAYNLTSRTGRSLYRASRQAVSS